MKKILLSVGLGIIDGFPLGNKISNFFKRKKANKIGYKSLNNISNSNDNKPDYTRLITNIVTIAALVYLLKNHIPLTKDLINLLTNLF